MPTSRILRRLSVTAIGAAVIASGAAGSAQAASITVCQKKKGGAVRVIKSTKKCKKSEVRLTIPTGELVQGPAGAQGAKGDRGPGAVRFAGDAAVGGDLTATKTVGDFNIKFTCNFVLADYVFMRVTSAKPTAGQVSYVLQHDSVNSGSTPVLRYSTDTAAANAENAVLVGEMGTTGTNSSTFTAVVDNGTQTLTVRGTTTIETGGTCHVRASAVVTD